MVTTGDDSAARSLGERLAAMAPGSELGAVLAATDPALVDDADLLEVIAAWDRQIAHANAQQLAAMATFAKSTTTRRLSRASRRGAARRTQ